ncbi:hypothetical protein MKW92_001703 [Papaver armeniacum]|nr:hypothetical protein MKW92_001703 [Papaver armeniacum]
MHCDCQGCTWIPSIKSDYFDYSFVGDSICLSIFFLLGSQTLMEKIPWINHFAQTPDREWFETDGDACEFGKFLICPRDRLHHGGWMMKVISWCLMVIFIFFLPNGIVTFYTISKFGSGLFLLVQVVLFLYFVHRWNDNWVKKDEQLWCIALFVVSLVCYVATFSFSGLLFNLFTPSGHDCRLNTSLVFSHLTVFVFAIVVLHPAVNGSLLSASVISVEPRNYECKGLHNHSKVVSTVSLTLGLVTYCYLCLNISFLYIFALQIYNLGQLINFLHLVMNLLSFEFLF